MHELILVTAAIALPAAWGGLVALAMTRWWPAKAAESSKSKVKAAPPIPPVDYQI